MSDSSTAHTICYICGDDLSAYYKTDKMKQEGLNSTLPNIPELTKWNGEKKSVCSPCYKASIECMQVYDEKHGTR